MRPTNRTILTVLTVVLLAGSMLLGNATSSTAADAAWKHRPCANEGMNGCTWDAKHLGNGQGVSYMATPSGRVIYISHRRAHRLLNTGR